MEFVLNPNLPKNASSVIISEDASLEIENSLNSLGIKVFRGTRIEYAENSVRSHIDTQIFHLGGKEFVASPLVKEYYEKMLGPIGGKIISGRKSSTGTYPDDVAYNVAYTGKVAIHNFKYTDNEIFIRLCGRKIKVNQGYSKCCCCIVDENSVITEDEGIAQTLLRHNIDVLKISAGDVYLEGQTYGFLGGASGKIKSDLLAFAGDIKKHREYDAIYDFCIKRGVNVISLATGKLCDIGSIVPVTEKE